MMLIFINWKGIDFDCFCFNIKFLYFCYIIKIWIVKNYPISSNKCLESPKSLILKWLTIFGRCSMTCLPMILMLTKNSSRKISKKDSPLSKLKNKKKKNLLKLYPKNTCFWKWMQVYKKKLLVKINWTKSLKKNWILT